MNKCQKCEKEAVYNVWYVGVGLLITGGNIAYNRLCEDCTSEEIKNGIEGYLVACAKRIDDGHN